MLSLKLLLGIVGVLSIGSGGAIGAYLLSNSSSWSEYPWEFVVKKDGKTQGYCGYSEGKKIASKKTCETVWTKKIIQENQNTKYGAWMRVKTNGYSTKVLDNWTYGFEKNNGVCEMKSDKSGWTEFKCFKRNS